MRVRECNGKGEENIVLVKELRSLLEDLPDDGVVEILIQGDEDGSQWAITDFDVCEYEDSDGRVIVALEEQSS